MKYSKFRKTTLSFLKIVNWKNLIIVLALTVPFLIFLIGYFQNSPKKVTQVDDGIVKFTELNEGLVLVKGYPDFESLTVEDFQPPQDIRYVTKYEDKTVVVGYNKIFEFDQNNRISRRLIKSKMNCVSDATRINNILYVLCSSGKIYLLNLDTGLVEGIYLHDGSKYYYGGFNGRNGSLKIENYSFTNSSITSLNDDLWLGGYNGILRIDTKNKTSKVYLSGTIGFKSGREYKIFSNKNFVWTLTYGGENGLSFYNPSTDSWDPYNVEKLKSFIGQNDVEIKDLGYMSDSAYFVNSSSPNKPYYSVDFVVKYNLKEGLVKVKTYNADEESKMFEGKGEYKNILRDKLLPGMIVTNPGNYMKLEYEDEDSNKVLEFKWPSEEIEYVWQISNTYDDSRYMVSKNGVWSLHKGEMLPTLINNNLPTDFYVRFMYQTKTGEIIMIGNDSSYEPREFVLEVYVYNLKSSKYYNISPSKRILQSTDSNLKEKYYELVGGRDLKFSQEDNNIVKIYGATSKEIGNIDLVNYRMDFNK